LAARNGNVILVPSGERPVAERVTHAAVNALYDAYERRDFQRVAALIHDDIDWVIYGPVSIFPFAGPRRGRAQVMEALAGIADQFALESYKREIVIVEGDRAAVMSDVSFKQRATGRMLRFRIANFLRFQDGRIVEFREFANTFDVVEQALGHELKI
jgi:ketosteroid isomerase-like protein